MSYDLRIAVKVVDKGKTYFPVIATPERHSPTYNLGLMFRKCTGWDFNQGEFYRADKVLPKIEKGIHELKYNEEMYIKMNPENGWGDTKSALAALESLEKCIHGCTSGDECWEEMPLHLLWVAW